MLWLVDLWFWLVVLSVAWFVVLGSLVVVCRVVYLLAYISCGVDTCCAILVCRWLLWCCGIVRLFWFIDVVCVLALLWCYCCVVVFWCAGICRLACFYFAYWCGGWFGVVWWQLMVVFCFMFYAWAYNIDWVLVLVCGVVLVFLDVVGWWWCWVWLHSAG